MKKEACQDYRVEWLSSQGLEAGHSGQCSVCRSWTRSAARQQAALSGLQRLAAPQVLDARVEQELAGDRLPRLLDILGAVIRHPAPPQLDERVAALLREPLLEPLEVRALRSLEPKRAPAVLFRLLDEELAAPERERVERFAGNLERLPVPPDLEQRISTTVRRRSLLRLVVAPLATLSAAGLMVWMTVRWSAPETASWRFDVVQAASLEELHPMARALAESMAGGVPREERR